MKFQTRKLQNIEQTNDEKKTDLFIDQAFRLPNDSLNIREFYKNKTILLTGCTGFVGKVILQKFL